MSGMAGLLVNIDVPDRLAAERFYVEAFGLTPTRRFGSLGVELSGWASPVYLLEKPLGSIGAAAQPRDYARHWSPIHLDVVVDDIDSALEVARAVLLGSRAPVGAAR